MRGSFGTTRIFAERGLRDYLEQKRRNAILLIESEPDDYLLNVNRDDYIEHISSHGHVDNLEILEDEIHLTSSERMIPAEDFPNSFNVYAGKSYRKNVLKFHIPFIGDAELLKCSPSSGFVWTMEIQINDGEISFEIINFTNDVEDIRREKDYRLRSIREQLANVGTEVKSYNASLGTLLQKSFDVRKQQILDKNGLLAALGVPVKRSGNVASTFSVPPPSTRKKITVSRPVVTKPGFKPEPTLDESAYFEILKLIHDVGKEFERLPSLYAGKQEEHLRDHFLMMLEPNFQGSATGETFNSAGKTDILLRYESSNVFIAECKFWKGPKSLLDTISQLLSYLTWRDSKAAIVIFVSNKDFSSVLQSARETIPKHANYLGTRSSTDETWFNYEVHLNGDRNRVVKLAAMLYHLPLKE